MSGVWHYSNPKKDSEKRNVISHYFLASDRICVTIFCWLPRPFRICPMSNLATALTSEISLGSAALWIN